MRVVYFTIRTSECKRKQKIIDLKADHSQNLLNSFSGAQHIHRVL